MPAIKLIDVVYYHHEFTHPQQVLKKHEASLGFADFISQKLHIQFVKHLDYQGEQMIHGVKYNFFKRSNQFYQIPFKTHRFIKSQHPDVVLIEGLIFPLQLIALKLKQGKGCRIIVQHHGERPFTGIKKMLQQFADRFIDGYMFTAKGNAAEWVNKKIIRNIHKCHEILEASTFFEQQNKEQCKKELQLIGDPVFLWVGRLNANKDPLTVLCAFEKYIDINKNAKLYMIFQTDELLSEIKTLLSKNLKLQNSVFLKGKIAHSGLEKWYNAADYYISASHKEGSGYALLEAMACGCIPIVTDIPSFKKITKNGEFGILFPAGNAEKLFDVFCSLYNFSKKEFSEKVLFHFKNNLFFKNIADDIYSLCQSLTVK